MPQAKKKIKKLPSYLIHCFIPTERNGYKPYLLRNKALATYSAVLIFIKITISLLFIFYPNIAYLSDITPDKLIRLTNQRRIAQGLIPLTVNPKLTEAAQKKAQDMLEKNYFEHTAPDGTTPWKWIKEAGYHYLYAGENLAMDFVTAEGVLNAWMASSSHRANILSSNFREIGIAVLHGKLKGKSTCLVVQMFGSTSLRRIAAKPSPLIPQANPTLKISSLKPIKTSADNLPPEAPKIFSPKNNSFVSTSTPTISGKAEPNSIIFIIINGKEIDRTITSKEGDFSLTISNLTPLKDGTYELKVKAQDRAGNISQPSQVHKFTIDTQPPLIDITNSYINFDREKKSLNIFVYVRQGPKKVLASFGTNQVVLENHFGLWSGKMKIKNSFPPSVEIKAQDTAGNTISIPLPTQGKIQSAFIGPVKELDQGLSLKAHQISKKIYFGVLAFLVSTLILNILIKIKIQHPSTIIFSILLCGMTILLLLI